MRPRSMIWWRMGAPTVRHAVRYAAGGDSGPSAAVRHFTRCNSSCHCNSTVRFLVHSFCTARRDLRVSEEHLNIVQNFIQHQPSCFEVEANERDFSTDCTTPWNSERHFNRSSYKTLVARRLVLKCNQRNSFSYWTLINLIPKSHDHSMNLEMLGTFRSTKSSHVCFWSLLEFSFTYSFLMAADWIQKRKFQISLLPIPFTQYLNPMHPQLLPCIFCIFWISIEFLIGICSEQIILLFLKLQYCPLSLKELLVPLTYSQAGAPPQKS